jgi:hypothetical protein
VIIVPSFVLLIGLVLGGRFDEGAPTVEEQHAPRRGARRPLVTVAGGLLVAGALLTFLGEGLLRALGVICLGAFAVTGVAELLRPEAPD